MQLPPDVLDRRIEEKASREQTVTAEPTQWGCRRGHVQRPCWPVTVAWASAGGMGLRLGAPDADPQRRTEENHPQTFSGWSGASEISQHGGQTVRDAPRSALAARRGAQNPTG